MWSFSTLWNVLFSDIGKMDKKTAMVFKFYNDVSKNHKSVLDNSGTEDTDGD